MEVYLKKSRLRGARIYEISPLSVEDVKKLRNDVLYKAELTMVRNPRFHKKFFALINCGHTHTKLDLPFERYRKHMIIKAGYFISYVVDGKLYFEAESISFGSMSEEKFQEVYSRVLDKVIEDVGADKEVFERELLNFCD